MLYMTIVIIIMAIVNWFMPKRMDRRDIIVLIISYVEIVALIKFFSYITLVSRMC